MEDSEKVEVIQEHIKALRDEAQRNADSQRKLFQWVIIGVAGTVALRQDIKVSDIQEFLPLAPILAMLIIAFWLAETGFSFRCGRWLSIAERRINALAFTELVSYEQELLRWRRRIFNRHWGAYTFAYLAFSAGYYLLVAHLMSMSELGNPPSSSGPSGFPVVIYTLAVISNLVALAQLLRVRYELRQDIDTSSEEQRGGKSAPNPVTPADA